MIYYEMEVRRILADMAKRSVAGAGLFRNPHRGMQQFPLQSEAGQRASAFAGDRRQHERRHHHFSGLASCER